MRSVSTPTSPTIKHGRIRRHWNSLRRSVYSFTRSKFGAFVVVLCAFITLNSMLHLLETFIGIAIVSKTTLYESNQYNRLVTMYTDNIAGRPFYDSLCYEPMDIVYTWVNGSDPKLQDDLKKWKRIWREKQLDETNLGLSTAQDDEHNGSNSTRSDDVTGSNRFRDNEELRYSLRSLQQFGGWVRNVYIVTNGQVPNWLDISHPRIHIVTHEEIFPDKSHLPTFSSPAIESNLFRIPGLSENFIYLNDDVMFGNDVYPEDFLSHSVGQKVYLSWDVPDCAPGCGSSWIGDGYCDLACNVTQCDFDGGDCIGPNAQKSRDSWYSSDGSSSSTDWSNWYSPKKDEKERCSSSCPDKWLGDKFCDQTCNVKECGFDSGDCGIDDLREEIPSFMVTKTKHLKLKFGTPSIFLNLTNIFPVDRSKITEGKTVRSADGGVHDNEKNDIVRTSTILQTHKILLYTFYPINETVTESKTMTIFINGTVTIDGQPTVQHVDITLELLPKTQSDLLFQNKDDEQSVLISMVDATRKGETRTFSATPSQNKRNEAKKESADFYRDIDEDDDFDSDEAFRKLMHRIEQIRESPAREKVPSSPPAKPRNQKPLHHVRGIDEDFIDADFEGINEEGEPYGVYGQLPERGSEDSKLAKSKPSRRPLSISSGVQRMERSMSINDAQIVLHSRKHVLVEELDQLHKRKKLTAQLEETMRESREQEQQMLSQQPHEANRRSPTARRLLDSFSSSLIFVNHLLNRDYGQVARKVPAHMPHMIQKRVFETLHAKWNPQFMQTSSNKFRSPNDMQFAFSYFYYLMHESKLYSSTEFFRETLDRNKDTVLQDYEIQYLALILKNKKIKVSKIQDLAQKQLESNSSTPNDTTKTTTTTAAAASGSEHNNNDNANDNFSSWEWDNGWNLGPSEHEQFIEYYEAVRDRLYSFLHVSNSSSHPNYDSFVQSGLDNICASVFNRTEGLYPYSLMTLDEVGFHMIGDEIATVQRQLDELRQKRPKFICLNDDMNKTSPNPEVVELLHSFFNWYYPERSQFELPPGEHNPYTHITELRAHIKRQKMQRWLSSSSIVAVFLSLIYCAFCCATPLKRLLFAGSDTLTDLPYHHHHHQQKRKHLNDGAAGTRQTHIPSNPIGNTRRRLDNNTPIRESADSTFTFEEP